MELAAPPVELTEEDDDAALLDFDEVLVAVVEAPPLPEALEASSVVDPPHATKAADKTRQAHDDVCNMRAPYRSFGG